MRRISSFLFLSLFIFISSLQVSVAQNVFGGIVSFDKMEHDYGDVLVTDKDLECTFTVKNISDKPIAIHSVITSCGCAEPFWTKSPLKPGECGKIKIIYNNDQGPYPFMKNITVYISGLKKPVMLKIKGKAYEKPKSLEELYPLRYGSLGFKSQIYATGHIAQGLSGSVKIDVSNLTSRDTEIDFADMDSGISIEMEDKKIPAGTTRTFTCTLNTAETAEKMWGEHYFTFSILNNGKKYKEAIFIVSSIYDNFTSMTNQERRDAALPKFDLSSKDFGKVKKGDILEFDYGFRNIGKTPFVMHNATPYISGEPVDFVSVDYGAPVAGNEKGNVHVKVDTSGQPEGSNMIIVNIITNSPTRPLVNLFIVYDIE